MDGDFLTTLPPSHGRRVTREQRQFTRALRDLADAGRSTPCQSDPESWFSERADIRAEAAQACTWCQAFASCATYTVDNNERYGVWAGVDRATPLAKDPLAPLGLAACDSS
jgi:hypothetical protein